MSFTTVRLAVGRVVLTVGVLILLFIPYLLWGTGLMTARSQDSLRQQFEAEQRQAATRATSSTTTTTPSTTPSTTDGHPQVAPTESDPPIGSAVGTISIPKIGLSMVVVEGVDDVRLRQGPGHYPGTPLPGEAGNAAIAGHRTTYLHPFYNLNELQPGDPIQVTTIQGTFVYDTVSSQSVSPNDVSVVATATSPELTLTTCTPRFSASQRLVVHAALVSSILTRPAAAKGTPTKPKSSSVPSSSPSSSSGQDWVAAIAWGIAVTVLLTAVWMIAARTRRGARAAVLVGGTLVGAVVVFLFFQSVAPLLPASY